MVDSRLNELLLTVQRPGRYVGGEWNAVRKTWDGRIPFLLAFPDIYEVGMSHLGMKILYGILNGRDDCVCERVFAPWPDFEQVLRHQAIPLFSLESHRPLRDFAMIGFSVGYELSHTNILTMLDCGGIPLRAADRSDADPLVIAGGPAVVNPEPIAAFIDVFVIGEGEEVVGEIVDVYKGWRSKGPGSRGELLRELAKIEGVYVPSLYRIAYHPDGTIAALEPKDGAPAVVRKRIVRDLDGAYYPVDQIVPNIQIVHDRIALEVMRGCKHACKFCQASAIYRPCRERSREKVLALAKAAYASTGYDEMSLLSLSSGDYSAIKSVLTELNAFCKGRASSISVPSLRVEDVLEGIPSLIAESKKSGLTFAPEAATPRLRREIGKDIPVDRLFDAAAESFRRGWRRVKLYFMIGLPTETEEDVRAIAALITAVSEVRRRVDNKAANVVASINAFVPKPHTLYEREPMEEPDRILEKRRLIRSGIASRFIELDFHALPMSRLEAVFSRGDRRLADVIMGAWQDGCRFDGWQDHFKEDRWSAAFARAGLDPAFYAHRRRPEGEILPWQVVSLR